MENKPQEQCYSIDGECFFSYEKLMYQLREYNNKGEEVEVFEADKKPYHHSDFINIDLDYFIEEMQTAAMDDCGEIAEEYLDDITTDKKDELQNYIAEWFNKNAKLNFYGVENERKIMVIVE